jgi:predicted enzyme related to lactoylglutathione lyase
VALVRPYSSDQEDDLKNLGLAAVKLRTVDLKACEKFFTSVFRFEVTHRYGGAGAPFEEIVMSQPERPALQLKFVQFPDQPSPAPGDATIQIVVEDVDASVDCATSHGAAIQMQATDFTEAGVRMAVIATALGHPVEVVQVL